MYKCEPISTGCQSHCYSADQYLTRADRLYLRSLIEDIAIDEMISDYRNTPAVIAHLSQPIQPLTYNIEVAR